jgi:hypothetical protein
LNAIAQDASRAEMLAAATARADAGLSAHDLRDQAVNVPRPGQKMAVAAVVGEDDVTFNQGLGDGDPRSFLANAGMHGAEKLPLGEEAQESFFNAADEQRAGIKVAHPVRPGVVCRPSGNQHARLALVSGH